MGGRKIWNSHGKIQGTIPSGLFFVTGQRSEAKDVDSGAFTRKRGTKAKSVNKISKEKKCKAKSEENQKQNLV